MINDLIEKLLDFDNDANSNINDETFKDIDNTVQSIEIDQEIENFLMYEAECSEYIKRTPFQVIDTRMCEGVDVLTNSDGTLKKDDRGRVFIIGTGKNSKPLAKMDHCRKVVYEYYKIPEFNEHFLDNSRLNFKALFNSVFIDNDHVSIDAGFNTLELEDPERFNELARFCKEIVNEMNYGSRNECLVLDFYCRFIHEEELEILTQLKDYVDKKYLYIVVYQNDTDNKNLLQCERLFYNEDYTKCAKLTVYSYQGSPYV